MNVCYKIAAALMTAAAPFLTVPASAMPIAPLAELQNQASGAMSMTAMSPSYHTVVARPIARSDTGPTTRSQALTWAMTAYGIPVHKKFSAGPPKPKIEKETVSS